MNRRGRPKKSGLRQPNGQPYRPPPRDQGTGELQSRREFLAGRGDKTLTTFPLGILLVNETISEDQYRAGCRFAWLHAVVIGKGSLAAIDFERTHGRYLKQIDEDKEFDHQELFRKSMKALDGLSRHHRDDVVGLCVYDRLARFMRPVAPHNRDVAHAKRIIGGLFELAAQYGFIDSRNAERRVLERLD